MLVYRPTVTLDQFPGGLIRARFIPPVPDRHISDCVPVNACVTVNRRSAGMVVRNRAVATVGDYMLCLRLRLCLCCHYLISFSVAGGPARYPPDLYYIPHQILIALATNCKVTKSAIAPVPNTTASFTVAFIFLSPLCYGRSRIDLTL